LNQEKTELENNLTFKHRLDDNLELFINTDKILIDGNEMQ